MNTPRLETDRLILRKFTEDDLEALYYIHSDEEVNRFLPWFPLRNMEDARAFYEERLMNRYKEERAYNYAVCLKENDYPVGYVNVSMDDSYDFGYGLRRKFWHRGIITEAGKAVIEQLRIDGIPYITATHDVNNPRSGSVMKRLGMKYRYSYQEQWQPKNYKVIFRLYQLNFTMPKEWRYDRYWKESQIHFVEEEV